MAFITPPMAQTNTTLEVYYTKAQILDLISNLDIEPFDYTKQYVFGNRVVFNNIVYWVSNQDNIPAKGVSPASGQGWVIFNTLGSSSSSSGASQFIGTGPVKGVQYMGKRSEPAETIIIPTKTNAFSVESFELADGASLVVEDDATYKIL